MCNNFFMHPNAVACITGGEEAPDIKGCVQFFQRCGGVLTVVNVSGLPEENVSGFFAFHIHEGSDCTGEGFENTKSHYNPENVPHPEHSGDLPPLLSCKGKAFMAVFTNRFSVKEIIGRTVVIHSGADDFVTQPSGNAKAKIACGVIRKS